MTAGAQIIREGVQFEAVTLADGTKTDVFIAPAGQRSITRQMIVYNGSVGATDVTAHLFNIENGNTYDLYKENLAVGATTAFDLGPVNLLAGSKWQVTGAAGVNVLTTYTTYNPGGTDVLAAGRSLGR